MPSDNLRDAASGRWPEILMGLGGLSADQLQDEHQPCPACGGTDRYRWDNNEGDGSFFCSQCGGKDRTGGGGNGMDLLMRVCGWEFREASKQVRQFLGAESVTDAVRGKAAAKPFRQAEKPPADAPPPPLRGAVAQWCYRNAAGEQLFYVQRVSTTTAKGAPSKIFPLVIWLDGQWHKASKKDPFKADWPEPRPLYRLPDLIDRPNAMVVIAEGEKAVDAAAELFPEAACIGWRNGAKAARKSDWSPLAGRDVVFLPDADKDGETSIGIITGVLRDAGVQSLRVCRAPEGSPEGWDIADGLADGWAPLDAEIWLQGAEDVELGRGVEADGGGGSGDGGDGSTVDHGPVRWDAFGLLGFDQGCYYYQPGSSGQIVELSAAAHTPNNLMQMAAERWWKDRWPRLNKDGEVIGVHWQTVVSDLIQAQHVVGIYDPYRVRGPGVWLDDGRPVVHLGDRIIVDGEVRDVRQGPDGSNFIYDKRKTLEGPGDAKPLTDEEGWELLNLAESFNWEQRSAGMLLAGWLFIAAICGVLDWRPHIWLTAAAGSGKTTILRMLLIQMLGNFVVVPVGASTEAGIRQRLASAARPVVFDEAESNEEQDKNRVQRIIELARVSSSRGDGEVLKGTVAGTGMNFAVRSMFLFCSIATALKGNADKERFTVLTLRRAADLFDTPEAAQANWRGIQSELQRIATPERGRRMLARSFELAAVAREAAQVFADACALRLGTQRMGDQYGAMCAGAWCLVNRHVPTREEVEAWLKNYPLTSFTEDSRSETDENTLLETLAQSQERVEVVGSGSQTRTVLDMVELAVGPSTSPLEPVTPELAIKALGRLGMKVKVDGLNRPDGELCTAPVLLLATSSKAITRRILRNTPWADCWARVVLRVPGAFRAGNHRFSGIGQSKAVAVPLEALRGG
jgi:putative DNA primase/helicase